MAAEGVKAFAAEPAERRAGNVRPLPYRGGPAPRVMSLVEC
jgi:hypothetical protein